VAATPNQSKAQRREAAREAARITREKQAKRDKLLKWLVPTSVSVGLVAVGVIVTLVIVNSVTPNLPAGPANMASDGIAFESADGAIAPVETAAIEEGEAPTETDWSSDVPHIETFVDWTCPACKAFEEQYSGDIRDMVESGEATLEVHPVAILDRVWQGSRFSSRAANAAACVAAETPEAFLDAQDAIYAAQPQEGTTGLTDAEILEVLASAGAESDALTSCVEDETYAEWVTEATARADIRSTPTLTVDGETWDPNSGDFLDFVRDAA
jgi:hypothetical protein